MPFYFKGFFHEIDFVIFLISFFEIPHFLFDIFKIVDAQTQHVRLYFLFIGNCIRIKYNLNLNLLLLRLLLLLFFCFFIIFYFFYSLLNFVSRIHNLKIFHHFLYHFIILSALWQSGTRCHCGWRLPILAWLLRGWLNLISFVVLCDLNFPIFFLLLLLFLFLFFCFWWFIHIFFLLLFLELLSP